MNTPQFVPPVPWWEAALEAVNASKQETPPAGEAPSQVLRQAHAALSSALESMQALRKEVAALKADLVKSGLTPPTETRNAWNQAAPKTAPVRPYHEN